MSTLAVSVIRQRIATQIASALPAWRQSRYAWDLFGVDADHCGPLAYAVGAPSTGPYEGPGRDRQRISEGTLVTSEIRVRHSHALRDDTHLADYDAALDAEQDLVAAVMATDQADLELRLETAAAERVVLADGGWLLIESVFRVDHRYPLQ